MSGDNSDQIEFWNGSMATNWVAADERMDELLAPLSQLVLQRAGVQRGESILDIGCGCGATSMAMAEAGAQVLGIDVSAPMLARAVERGRGNDGVKFVEADAASHAFEPKFDLLFSRFGVMFFADPVAAFTNLHSALSPGGRLCFICWQAMTENPWLAAPMGAAQPFLPDTDPPAPSAPGPFSMADAELLSNVLNTAGFSDVAVEAHAVEMRVGSNLEEAMEFYTRLGPLAGVLGDIEPDNRAAALAAVSKILAASETAAGIALPGGCWIATANQ
ncbi:MAG: class I SAM-dependent methyltransferase [Pseudomonadales bacterium]